MLQCLHSCGLWPVSQGGDGVHGHPMPPLVRHGVNWEGLYCCPCGKGVSQVDCGLVGEELGAPRGSNCLSCPGWLHRAISHAAPSVFCLP